MTTQELYEFIDRHDHAVLASVTPLHTPEAALVGIAVTPELELVFDASKNSRKYPNIRQNDQVALVIGWANETTVQYEGEVWEPSAEMVGRYKDVYFAKFPNGRKRESWPDIAYLVVTPRWIRYSDFNHDPAQIVELRLGK
ncbi:pyridoxamine 5'-phosphate oxidase family protein [Crenobacter sp. SG2303]|uniref:Pyridoxamine 5'-phosphate oxidase family protein n=1 Tax=Crenobacter oryzisoli TaxID=3056844 RepID=A0ABT7XN42_9NEIS|nr:pyridoxamine 5'-phosphate oxidase family protein [Crenobacter sp. SG2303]MDN0075209.1 pyridoxamine 5'-phosphate oxidase family protein [Crenobacter sp. SG2303]